MLKRAGENRASETLRGSYHLKLLKNTRAGLVAMGHRYLWEPKS